MNRKSFYYPFQDKCDLVNWICYTEFMGVIKDKEYENGLEFLSDICIYLEQNKKFYRTIFQYDGQNSFLSISKKG